MSETTPESYWKTTPVWVSVLEKIAVVNFIAFIVVAMVCGGFPFFGLSEKGGHYYSESHGLTREISVAQYHFATFQFGSTLTTTLAAVAGWFFALVKKHEYER